MTAPRKNRNRFLALLGALALAAAAQAALPRMPGKYALPKSAKSPGQVSFNHVSHVDEEEPNCVTCHPRLFSMLEPGKTTGLPAITHKAMENGQACGACHGKKAFKLTHCDLCHEQ